MPWRKKDFVIHKSLKSSLSVTDFLIFLFVLESNLVFYSGIISSSGCAVAWFVYTLFGLSSTNALT